jgi:hypothetical protein
MSDPLVSILIPCHNSASWLAASLGSVLTQTHPRCEVIVVDDGSTDASATVAESFSARGVRLVRQSQQGAAAARNTALRHAQGDFIQFLDADDLLHPEKIARQIDRLRSGPDGLVANGAWGNFFTTPEEAVFQEEPVWRDANPLDWLILSWSGGGMMHPAAWLTPRAVAERAGPWNETLSLDDDGEYFCRVLLASSGICFCGDARSYYRRHPGGSLSHAKTPAAWRSSHDVCRLVQQAALAREDSPRVRRACALNHWRFAFQAWPYARPLARASLAEARRLDPTAPRPTAGPRFEVLARLIGWRLARTLQHHFSRLRRA